MTSRPQNLAARQLAGYRKADRGTQPDYLYPPYASTVKRSPREALVMLPVSLSEVTGPVFGPELVKPGDNDLTGHGDADPIGERIVVSGRVLDANARPVAHTLIEIWQANSAGRYRFVTIRPGAYPWKNDYNAWRPAHIHFSLFGPAFATRLVTQMYFPGDPLLDDDPMYASIPDPRARRRLVSMFDWETTVPERALGYRFDIVLRGRDETPMEDLGARRK